MLCYAMPHEDNFLESFTRIHHRIDKFDALVGLRISNPCPEQLSIEYAK